MARSISRRDGIRSSRRILFVGAKAKPIGVLRWLSCAFAVRPGRVDTRPDRLLDRNTTTTTGSRHREGDHRDVWATDGARPVLWHLTSAQVAAGHGTPTTLPLAPEMTFDQSNHYNIGNIVLLSDRRLVVDRPADGALFRIDLDPRAPNGRTITPITGATVPECLGMLIDGHRLVVADFHDLSVVGLSDDASHGTVVTKLHDAAFQYPVAVTHAQDRYLVLNAKTNGAQPYTVVSVPAAG